MTPIIAGLREDRRETGNALTEQLWPCQQGWPDLICGRCPSEHARIEHVLVVKPCDAQLLSTPAPSCTQIAHSGVRSLCEIVRRTRRADIKTSPPSSVKLDYAFLRDACPAFTAIWQAHNLEQMQAPLPKIVNRDGASLVFSETRFPILPEKTERISERLDALPNGSVTANNRISGFGYPNRAQMLKGHELDWLLTLRLEDNARLAAHWN